MMRRFAGILLTVGCMCVAGAATAQAPADTTAPDTTAAAPKTPAPTTPAMSESVKRAIFCSGVTEREPVDQLTTLAPPADKVYFFTELVGLEGRTITHRWKYNDSVVAEVPISVGSARWRCYSIKTLGESMTGTWAVEVVDDAGTKLHEASFTYGAAQ